ncbi:MAG: SpoIIE family protein phosphatase [Vicingaceae bacterium]|nr:SpoIIE family protein phosphatase [Vicingaceae bacterium]
MVKLGTAYNFKGDYRASEKYFGIAISEAKKAGNLELEFLATENYLQAFLNLKSPVKGLETILELKSKAKKNKNKALLFKAYELENSLYLISGINFDERRMIADTLLKIAEELNDSFLVQRSYFQLAGTTYGEESISFYKKSLNYLDEKNKFALSSLYNNISGRYRLVGDLDQALIYADSAYLVSIEAGRKVGIAAALYRKAEAYFFKNDFEKAVDYGLLALKAFQDAGVLRRQDICAKLICDSYKGMGKFEKALKYKEMHLMLKDSLKSRNELEDLKFVEQKFNFQLAQKRDSTDIALKMAKIESMNAVLENEKMKNYLLYGGVSVVLCFAIFLFIGFQRKKRDNLIIAEQKIVVEEKNKEITDSIQYAKRIQSAILPSSKVVKEYLKDSFILYLPKDIVAGDFYWMESKNDKILFAAADCTGHGVPGAMVSVVCNNGLNRSVREHGLTDPGQILDKTREIVLKEFEKSEDDVKDGMDIALCCLEKNTLKYAGAHNPLWVIRDGELIETKANKQPIGQFDNPEPYKTHVIELQKGDNIYIFSDGYADQFGGEKGKKMKTANFKKLLLSIQKEPMEVQRTLINNAFEDWKGSLDQLDDVCVIGVAIS